MKFLIDYTAESRADALALLAEEELPDESVAVALAAAIDRATQKRDAPVCVHASGSYYNDATGTQWTDYHVAVKPIIFARPAGRDHL